MKNLKWTKAFLSAQPMLKTFVILLLSSVVVVAAGRKMVKYTSSKKQSTTALQAESITNTNSTNPTGNIIPPSPTVAGLGQYGEIPVGMYTGTPNVSVPLYNLQGKGLSVPISLSYHASGHKVDAIASWVGLGWSLNAGGVISRTVRGLPDEQGNGYLNQNIPIINVPTDINANSSFFDNLLMGNYDGQPDIYHFNVAGISGKFYIKNNSSRDVHFIPYRDDIELDRIYSNDGDNTNDGWILTTDAGIEYHFGYGYEEVTANTSTCSGAMSTPSIQVTGWMLKRIYNQMTDDEITFTYNAHTETYETGETETKYYNLNVGSLCATSPTDQTCLSENSSSTWHLDKITSSFGEVQFMTSNAREDVYGGVRLTQIIANDKGGTPLKSYDLQYNYFNPTSTGGNGTDLTTYRNKRLKLEEVIENSATGDAKPPYIFDYLDGADAPTYQLPARLSKSQDHWGFYNGATNSSLIPDINNDNIAGGGYRLPSSEHVKAGLLEKITYPTGGFNQFDYEAHEIGVVSIDLLMQDDSYITPGNSHVLAERPGGLTTDVDNFTLSHSTEITANVIATNSGIAGDWVGSITLVDAQGNQYHGGNKLPNSVGTHNNIKFQLPAGSYTLTAEALAMNDFTKVTLTWEENSIVSGAFNVSTLKKQTIGGVRIHKVFTQESATATPMVKKYTYETFDNASQPDRSSGRLISYPKYRFSVSNYENIGVACVEEVCSYTGMTSSSRAPLGTTQGNHIAYTHVTEWHGEVGENGKVEKTYSFAEDKGGASYPYIPPTSYDWQRGHLLKSTVYKNNGSTFIRQKETQNNYDFRLDKTLNNNHILGVNAENYINGTSCTSSDYIICTEENINQVYYGSCPGSTYWILPWQSNTPAANGCSIIGYGVCYNQPVGHIITNPNYYDNINIQSFAVRSQWFYVSSTTEKVYDENGLNPLTTAIDYIYDEDGTDGHQTQPIEVVTTNSDGVKYITKTKYSSDYAFTSTPSNDDMAEAMYWLQNNNRVLPVETISLIEKTSWSSPKVIGGQLSTFKLKTVSTSGNTRTFVMPNEAYVLETDVPIAGYTMSDVSLNNFVLPSEYNLEGMIEATDETGNVEQFRRNHGEASAIIWSNDKAFPIAKAINAAHNEIFYTSFEEDIANISPNSKTGVQSYNGTYTIPVPSTAPAGDYILSYWTSTSGSTWTYQEQIINYTSGSTVMTSNASGYVDEVRFYPVDALMTTYTYDKNTHLATYINNVNNQLARLEYDDFQRLENIYDFEDNLIKHKEYNFQNSGGTGNEVYNYIKEWTFLKANVSPTDDFSNINRRDKAEVIQFTDGLGRPIQSIGIGMASHGGDIVGYTEYDQFGRASKSYLPFVANGNNGEFVSTAANLQRVFNHGLYQTNNSFAETVYDNSPLNRVVEQGAPGDEWQIGSGHTKRVIRRLNTANEVRDFENNTFYTANELYVVQVIDEDGRAGWIYKDKFGRTIMVNRKIDIGSGGAKSIENISTYYLYDDFGRIEKVLSPEGTKIIKNNTWNVNVAAAQEQIYKYEYDRRGRMIRKKLPSADWITIIYDKLDRPVLTQDGELRNSNDWLYTKYDILGRPIITGLFENDLNRTEADLRGDVVASLLYETTYNNADGYTNTAFPTSYTKIHTITYYDDYDFNNDNTDDFSLDAQIGYTANDQFDRIRGQLTGTKVKVLDSSPAKWLHTVVFYDDRGQAIQIQGDNHLNGSDVLTNQFDFSGKLLRSERKHTAGGKNPLYVVSTFDYDHAGRLLNLRYGVGDANISGTTPTIILNTLRYDNIGRLLEKKLHSTNGRNYLQNIDYKFNIRGWLTDINNINFGGLTPVELSEELTGGLIDRIKDSEIEIDLNVSDLNAGIYDEVEVKDKHKEEKANVSEEKVNDEKLSLDVTSFQSSLTDMFTLDYQGRTVDEASYEQEFSQLRTDLDAEMTSQGITDQKARDLIEEEVLGYFKNNWLNVVANDNNDDLFAMHLDYTTSNTQTQGVAQYGGNISQATWRVRGDANKSVYGYQYDDLGRLTQAKYAEYDANNVYSNHDHYTVSNITYDLNGNIQTLNRMGFDGSGYSMIDQLNYSYKSNTNELDAITGDINTAKGFKTSGAPTTNQYVYDDNGRMTEDKNKGITITYNYLDLPTRIDYTSNANKYIEFKYDAAGVKLEKRVSDNGAITYTQYTAGIEYSGSLAIDGAVTLEMVYHSDGRFYTTDDGKTFHQEYILRDNLGNTRVVFEDVDNNGKVDVSEITQKTHYYPFGMEMEAPLTPQSAGYKHLYNGKEAVKDLDLGWYDYGARWYDASIARWSAIDPMGEMMASWSSYNYAFNNPVRFTDPSGMTPEDNTTPTDQDGNVVVTATGGDGTIASSTTIAPLNNDRVKPKFNLAQNEEKYNSSMESEHLLGGSVFQTVYDYVDNSSRDVTVRDYTQKEEERYTNDLLQGKGGVAAKFFDGGWFFDDYIAFSVRTDYNAGAIFEEFFHAAQYRWYGEFNQQSIKLETEAKVGVALNAYINYDKDVSNIKELIAFKSYLQKNYPNHGVEFIITGFLTKEEGLNPVVSDYFNRLINGDPISSDLKSKFRAEVVVLAKQINETYGVTWWGYDGRTAFLNELFNANFED